MTACVTVGATPGCVNLRIVRGDVYPATFRWRDATGDLIDTGTMAAQAMIRAKQARARVKDAPKEHTLICELIMGGGPGLGEIILGIDGDPPDPGDPDLRTNISIVIPADVTAGFPRVRGVSAEWAWDLQVWDPDDMPNTRRTIMAGDVLGINDWTYEDTP